MALTPYTAQCPNCAAEIDLTQSEMEMADGDIICGNCNNQFHAPDNLLKGFYSSKKTGSAQASTLDTNDMTTSDFDIAPAYRSYKRKRFLKGIFAFLLNLILLGFLIFQVLWANFDRWAAKENMRPIYGFLCSIEQLRCSLPAYVEPVDIKVENFSANLRDKEVYVLQAILTNYSSVYKEFPWLEVIFSDLDNYPVASGRFSPYQYLQEGEASGFMPPGKSFNILLEVRKPAKPVARYEMNVIAAN